MNMTPDKFMEEDLLKKRTIYLDGRVSEKMSKSIVNSILWLNAVDDSSEIILFINSNGGSVDAGLDIYDIVRHSKAPVTGIVFCRANSMASIILQACKIRKAQMQSQIILHNIRISDIEWHVLEDDLEGALRGTKWKEQAVCKILSERTGRTIEEITRVCKEGKTMFAEEAKEFGLIDEAI